MIRTELQKLDQSPRALRNFGLLVGGVFLLLGVIALARGRAWWPWTGVPGLVLMLLGLLAPRTLRWVNFGWMAMALLLGTVMSSVLLTLVFFLGFTPLGGLARLRGKDFLRRRAQVGESYWLHRDRKTQPTRADYERQF